MKTLTVVKDRYKEAGSNCLDGRDISRLAPFIPEEELASFGLDLKEEFKGKHVALEFTKENVLKQLQEDVAFGFEKALNRRGISSSMMYEVVQMWNWILEEGLEHYDSYQYYGLPLLKVTAVKYGFNNPIGDDRGDEERYS